MVGDKTVLTIRDNGEGIEKEALDKIFDPFFTTKEVGEGMGLGLTICYRIVQEYDGHISVRSERGKFCEFKLEFPSRNETAVEETPVGTARERSATRNECHHRLQEIRHSLR